MCKILKNTRIYLVFLISFLGLICFDQMIFSQTDTSKVTVSIATDKDSYELTDKANITIKIKNDNPYGIFVEELDLGLPDYITNQLNSEIPEKVEANSESIIELKDISLCFQTFRDVNLDGQHIKVGIVSSYETISYDSIFSVDCISKNHDKYNEYLSSLDRKDEAQRVAFFDFEIQDIDGVSKSLNGYAKIYIQIPEGWDAAELQAIFISKAQDEEFEEIIETIDGIKYLTFKTNHFSPYALFDPTTSNVNSIPEDINSMPEESNTSNSVNNVKTGDDTIMKVIILFFIILASLLSYLVFRNKKRTISMYFTLIFFIGCNMYFGDNISANNLISNKKIIIKDFDAKGFKDSELVLSSNITKCSSYADVKNWAFNEPEEKDNPIADVFFVSPTMYTGSDNMKITDENLKLQIQGACKIQKPIYAGGKLSVNQQDVTKLDYSELDDDDVINGGENIQRRFFSPYYRQIGYDAYTKSDRGESNLKIAYSDIKDAFQYYLDNYNKDTNNNMRPIILAGFSQGADMCIRLMKDFKDVLSGKLIACYAIGWRYTEKDKEECGFLPATGEKDTASVICFSCESENIGKESSNIKSSIIVPNGTKSYVINPLTWSTTNKDTNSDNNIDFNDGIDNHQGAVIYVTTDGSLIPNDTSTASNIKIGAIINEQRGTLIIDHKKLFEISPELKLFFLDCSKQVGGSGKYDKIGNDNGYIFHILDYQLFYNNLKENVKKRIASYLH